ncbi:MAG: hypothetical protein HC817_07155 [Saprospiraceae bacterium]|nr:hypothetical protein [Saprospiraceae bacterium]
MEKISKVKINEAVKRLVEAYSPLTIYLFGSYAAITRFAARKASAC